MKGIEREGDFLQQENEQLLLANGYLSSPGLREKWRYTREVNLQDTRD